MEAEFFLFQAHIGVRGPEIGCGGAQREVVVGGLLLSLACLYSAAGTKSGDCARVRRGRVIVQKYAALSASSGIKRTM